MNLNFQASSWCKILLTYGEGVEHLLQCHVELLVATVHLEVDLTKIWSSVHADLDEGGRRICRLLLLPLLGLD